MIDRDIQIFLSTSPEQTSEIAVDFVEDLIHQPERQFAGIIALSGNLGVGKTYFTKAMGKRLGITESMVSPTFGIAKWYPITNQQLPWKQFIHVDAYRLESWQELSILGFDEIIHNPENLVCIEWPEHVHDIDQDQWYHVFIEDSSRGDECRSIRIQTP